MAQLAVYVMGLGVAIGVMIYSLCSNEPKALRALTAICGLGVGLLTIALGRIPKGLLLGGAALGVVLSVVTALMLRRERLRRRAARKD